jgi:hypothetical protein
MQMPKVEYRWTLGNVLALLGMLVQLLVLGGGGLWYARGLEARVEESIKGQMRIEQMTDAKLEAMRRDVEAHSSRLGLVEMNYGRMDERLISMQSLLVNIDRKLELYTTRPGLQRHQE